MPPTEPGAGQDPEAEGALQDREQGPGRFWGDWTGPSAGPWPRDSLQLRQRLQVLNLLDLVVIKIQLSETL